MTYHNKAQDAAVQELSSDRIKGLSAARVREKQAQFGENRLREKKKKTNFQRFCDQFKDAMILILIAAAAISFVVACVEGEPKEFFEPVLILLIVVMNAIMGVILQYAEKLGLTPSGRVRLAQKRAAAAAAAAAAPDGDLYGDG